MKLFMVIYMAGQIAGVVGPLPYSIEECRERATARMAGADYSVTTPEGWTAHDVSLKCEFHPGRPQIEFGKEGG